MLLNLNIGIFGGDKRQVYIAKSLINQGYNVYTYQTADSVQDEKCNELNSLNELFDQCNVLIGPIPLTKKIASATSTSANAITVSNLTNLLKKEHFLIGGVVPSELTQFCNDKKIPCYDLMKNEKIAILNAIATAEGTIMEAIQTSEINIHGSSCLVLGYGRCAKVLAEKLKGLDAKVTVAARSEEALAYAEAAGFNTTNLSDMKNYLSHFDFIFNTIPSLILDKSCLEHVKHDVVIIDIASLPGGIDFDYAAQKKLNAKLCLGLPGKVAPKISAEILVNEIIKLLNERSD